MLRVPNHLRPMLSSLLIQTLNGLATASLLFLVGLGLTLIFGVTRIVNFAHGSFYMLGLYLSLTFTRKFGGGGFGFWGGALLAALTVAALGALIEIVILRRIYAAPELLQLITTFGLVLVIKDAALYLWGPDDILGPRAPGLTGAIWIFGRPLPTYDLVLIVLGPLMLLAVWLLLTRTHWGTLLRAATQDREMAAALGVNQAVLFTSVFAFGAFLAGFGGALSSPREPANLAMDLGIMADVFVVTVVGGLGSIPGAYVAAVLISVVKAWCIGLGDVRFGSAVLSFPKLTLVAEFIVMAVVLVWRPWGLFGSQPSVVRMSGLAIAPLPPPQRNQVRWALPVLLALAGLPLIVNPYTLVLLTDALIFALFAASLGLMMGAGGMASFGHAAYFGVGAYAAALAAKAGVPLLLCLGLGMTTAALFAALFGWFCVRLTGVSLAMLTLAFAQITWAVAFQWDAVTGGSNGLVGVWPPSWLATKTRYYLLTVLVAGSGIAVVWSLAHAPFGYALRGVRDSDVRAAAVGIDRLRLQWEAFVLAGAFAGLAGGLFVFSKGSLSPDTLSIPRSIDALVMVLLGGVQTLTGPVIGALVFTGLQDWITRVTPYWQAVLGSAVILLTVVFPAGIVGTLKSRTSPYFLALASARAAGGRS
jgi:branched-chain amino acid transport system permease protein